MKHLVMFSGGVASWCAAKRVAERHGTEGLTLLFADTSTEDEDTYRFLEEAAANVGGILARVSDGRDIWQVFQDERFIGNSRTDPCSRILKRSISDRFRDAHFDPADTTCYVGFDWTEEHRLERLRKRCSPWRYEAPMMDAPILEKPDMLAWATREGLALPRLYALGFPHANCGGFCVKAGHAHFAHLLRVLPDRYAYHERREQETREMLGRDDIAILTDRRGGPKRPITMRQFRERLEAQGTIDEFDWGGCGCFSEAS